MKTQIRKHTFETNSSTQHTITICNEGTDYTKYIGKTIILGKNLNEDMLWDDKKKKDPIVKLNMLWISLIGYDSSISNFIHYIDFIKKTLGELNINIEITTDEDDYKKWEYYGSDFSTVLGYAFETKDKLINFIFNKNSWYDCYEDDSCYECPYEDDILTNNETYWYRG